MLTEPNSRPALVLLCSDLADAGLDPDSLASSVRERWPEVSTEIRAGLCSELSVVANSVALLKPSALILALCSTWSAEGEIQEQALRGGLNPLAVQVVALATICRDGSSLPDRAGEVLSSMVARAIAFPGARPDNMKPVRRRGKTTRSRRNLFVLPPVTYQPVPTFDRGRCQASHGCDQCARVCPAQALQSTGRQIEIDREACSGCGLCMSVCPQRAVEMPGWSAGEVEAQLNSLLDARTGRPIAFFCSSAAPPTDPWLPVQVRCTVCVSVAAIVGTLARGAPAVALKACGEGCQPGSGNKANVRVSFCRSLLVAMGANPERVQCLNSTGGAPIDIPLTSLPARVPAKTLQVAGSGADAAAIMALADVVGCHSLRVEEPASPLGLITIDPDTCTRCGTCASACQTGGLAFAQTNEDVSLLFDPGRCTACGDCLSVCPEKEQGAIRLEQVVDIQELANGQRVVAQETLTGCRRCGSPVAPLSVLARVGALLGDDYLSEIMAELCPGCRQGF